LKGETNKKFNKKIKKIRTKFDIMKWNQILRDEIKKEDSIKKMIEKNSIK
jgi:hypothetical protein